MGLEGLKSLMGHVGMGKESALIDWGAPEHWMYQLAEQVGLSHHNKQEASPSGHVQPSATHLHSRIICF
jgi:hypothetical protein